MSLPLRTRGLLAAATATVTVAIAFISAACGSDEPTGIRPSTVASSASASSVLIMKDPWVKTAKDGMSAAFGTMMNTTDRDLVIVSATSTASAKMELHETTMVNGKMAMRPKTGGFTIPANGSHEFKPGADHLMLMDVTTPVKPGDEVTFTLTLNDGSTVVFTAVGKDFAGGNESYQPGMDGSAMPTVSSMSMGG